MNCCKYINILLLFLFLASASEIMAQNETYEFSKAALKTGSSRELSKYFNEIVEISIDGEKASYSKAHAEILFKDFFKKCPPLNFEEVHNGSTKGGLTYVIGKYTHHNGVYRVIIYIKKVRNSQVIDTLEFGKW